MEILIFDSFEVQSQSVADKMVALLLEKPDATFCLASGSSPQLAFQYFVEKVKNQKIDYSKANFIGLDEWVGIGPNNIGSCHYFLQNTVFQPLALPQHQYHLFDGLSDNLWEECKKMDNVVKEKNGIDLIIVGIGLNGHIGFNEPGVAFDNYCHLIDLEPITIEVGQKYFETETQLSQGITFGLQHFLEARQAILMANGTKKAEIIRSTVNNAVNNSIPSTIMQVHKNSLLMVDAEAAALL